MKHSDTIHPWYLVVAQDLARGDGGASLADALQGIVRRLASDPQTLETARLGVLGLTDEADVIEPLTEVRAFHRWATRTSGSLTDIEAALARSAEQARRDRAQLTADGFQVESPVLVLLVEAPPRSFAAALKAFSLSTDSSDVRLVLIVFGRKRVTHELDEFVFHPAAYPSVARPQVEAAMSLVARMVAVAARHGSLSAVRPAPRAATAASPRGSASR